MHAPLHTWNLDSAHFASKYSCVREAIGGMALGTGARVGIDVLDLLAKFSTAVHDIVLRSKI